MYVEVCCNSKPNSDRICNMNLDKGDFVVLDNEIYLTNRTAIAIVF